MNAHQSLEHAILRCRERGVIIPTFDQLAHPERIPEKIRHDLKTNIGLNDPHPLNLFRIAWKNEDCLPGGGFGPVNYIELPREITGVDARILVLLGRVFPTGAHKVGATFGPLVERLVTGKFDPTRQKAVWPSTGNYCRGGAFNANLLGCASVAVLPEEMSAERFEWLEEIGSEVIRTPGSESNVKEIFDKVNELAREHGDDIVILNQFADFTNPLWHYAVTGRALEEVFEAHSAEGQRLAGLFLTQGSAGTMAAGDYLRTRFPDIKIGAGEALQCPTMLYNGHGSHRIEGIGDKHIPWIFNIRNLDLAAAIDDEAVMQVMRLFNEPAGHQQLIKSGVPSELVDRLHYFGLSSIANVIGAIKMARQFRFGSDDIIVTIATDSMDLYGSRLAEVQQGQVAYDMAQAEAVLQSLLLEANTEHVLELSDSDRLRIHNLKYFTWVEQQGMSVEELDAQWSDADYWSTRFDRADELDEAINAFNERSGVLGEYLGPG